MPSETLVAIRSEETERIIAELLPGHVVQVYGPPMVGKSSVVEQAVDGSNNPQRFLSHKFLCENMNSLFGVLNVIAKTLGWQPSSNVSSADEHLILSLLTTEFENSPKSHHVLVFHKCQSLQNANVNENSKNNPFLNFIWRLIHKLSGKFRFSVVLTSNKMLPLKGDNTCCIEIGMLSFWDILPILRHYAPNINVLSYVSVCLNTIPLPGAVRLFAEEFLAGNECPPQPDILKEKMVNDDNFLSTLFRSKIEMVENWVPQDILTDIVHFCQYLGASFTEADLECVVADHNTQKWHRLWKYMKRNYIVWPLEVSGTSRFVVHPLVVYYWMQSRQHNHVSLQRQWFEKSGKRFTDFLCQLLHSSELNSEIHGNSGLVYGCSALEWPHIRHTIEMAIHNNKDTYKTFLQAAVSARSIIFKCFNEEALVMYQALYDCSKMYGDVSENAMIEAILGHLKASTVVLAKGGTWQQAEDCLDSAIIKLREHGPPFALMWAIYRKAIILTRQGKYKEAQMCFKAARRVTVVEAGDSDLERLFGVSKLQVKEDKITRDIFTANALIFLGENENAQELLLACLQFMEDEYPDHPELATLLNSLGLVEERGHGDKEKAVEWYLKSYRERQKWTKFNKEILVVSLNNIGMIYLRLGKLAACKKYLEEALSIRRDHGWVHANTTLTLTHMGVLNIKCGDIAQAYKNTLDGDKILQEILPIHDTRLRINNTLGHLRNLLERDTFRRNEVMLEKSAGEYFEYAVEIASRTTGNLSDDGYHHLLLTHEHVMMLALGVSKEKYNRHKNAILPYFQVSTGIGRKVFVANEKIPNHLNLYNYFSTTDYEDIDKRIFAGHLAKACEYCQMISSFCTADQLWCGCA